MAIGYWRYVYPHDGYCCGLIPGNSSMCEFKLMCNESFWIIPGTVACYGE